MLNCEYCDYCKNLMEVSKGSEGENGCFCMFTGYAFVVDETKSDMEYPCKDISYQDYLNRSKVREAPSVIRGGDWKVLYKKQHTVSERKWWSIAV